MSRVFHFAAAAVRPLAVAVAVSLLAAAPVGAQDALPEATGRNHAVLIAVQEFENEAAYPPLQNTVNDMNALGDVLEKRYGYEVTRLFNAQATLNNVVTELRERLPNRVKPGDSVLVAFATHGKYSEADREGYLILKDTDNYKTGISLGNLNQFTKNRKLDQARAILFLLDACEMGKVETVEFRSVNVKPEVVMRKFRSIVTSAGYVRAADASPTNPMHSPFAEALIDALDRDAKPKQLYDMLLDISKEVKNKTAGNQMPKQRKLPSDQDGDFLFQQPSLLSGLAEGAARDGFELIREQVAQTLREAGKPGNEAARRRASAILIANKPMFDSMPADLQREYVRLMTVAVNPAAPEWRAEQAWVEEMLPRGGEMGKVKLAQLMIATGRSAAGVAMLEEVARPVATRSASAAPPSLRASAAAALLQLGAFKYDEWRKNRAYDAYADAAVERLAQAAALAQEAGQPQIAADIRLRIGHIHEEVARHALKTTAAERPAQAATQLAQHGQGAIEAYANSGTTGRARLASLKKWLNTEKSRLEKSKKDSDEKLAESTETLINALIREETRM